MTKARMLLILAALIFATRIEAADLPDYIDQTLTWTHPSSGSVTSCDVNFPSLVCKHGITPYDYFFYVGSTRTYGSLLGKNGQNRRCFNINVDGCTGPLLYVSGDNTIDLVVMCSNVNCVYGNKLTSYYKTIEFNEHEESCRFCAAQATGILTCENFHALYQAEHGTSTGGESVGIDPAIFEVTYPVEPVESMNVKEVSESIWSVFVPLEAATIGLLVAVFVGFLGFRKIRSLGK